jgi:hypothetical protein
MQLANTLTPRNLPVRLALVAAIALVPSPNAEAAARLRPPSVPLVTHDPYFSIWSPADMATGADTVHWTGRPHRLTSLARVDGRAFRLLGREPAQVAPLPQVDLEVMPTRTIYTFEGQGVRVTLTFMTPALPEDLDVLARPLSYLTYGVRATDGKSHSVAFYFDASAELAVDQPQQRVIWGKESTGLLEVLKLGSEGQPTLVKKGDDLRIDWGYVYLAAPKAAGNLPLLLPAAVARGIFAAGGEFPPLKPAMPLAASNAPVAGLVLDAAKVGPEEVSRWMMLAYDDQFSIKYFRQNLRPYWRRHGDDMETLLKKAAADYESLKPRCEAFDRSLVQDLRKVGGEEYAQLCTLAYRQTLAGNKICADANGQPLMFPKENFSNGCIGTVDVLFPQAPFFLVFSPALAKAMLVPILAYAASPRWPYTYAPHDLGTYPHATGQVYGMNGSDGDRMPVEESANMLIMIGALAQCESDVDLARQHWSMLTRWADYLVKEGLDPRTQLCSADMFGHLPRAANLALKAVIGIGSYAQLCELTGHPDDGNRYTAIARDYAAKWLDLAKDQGHTRLAYHLPGSWGMKHNLIWDRVLGLNLFPDSVGDSEIAWYLKVQNRYGLPVDNRTTSCLIDWAMWSIALARDNDSFQLLVAPLFRYANETPTRVPLGDWFQTTNAAHIAMQARPVVGGLFIKMLADRPTWNLWARRGPPAKGPWAPIPAGGPVTEVVPTAQKRPITWRYTLEKPAETWFQPGFDDSAWKQGPAGFGTDGTPGAVVRTKWNTQDIWLRREFSLTEKRLAAPCLRVHYDEDATVYINGVLAAELPGWTTGYQESDLTPAAQAALKPGKNLFAVHCHQTTGGQYIDVGLVSEEPRLPVRDAAPIP